MLTSRIIVCFSDSPLPTKKNQAPWDSKWQNYKRYHSAINFQMDDKQLHVLALLISAGELFASNSKESIFGLLHLICVSNCCPVPNWSCQLCFIRTSKITTSIQINEKLFWKNNKKAQLLIEFKIIKLLGMKMNDTITFYVSILNHWEVNDSQL